MMEEEKAPPCWLRASDGARIPYAIEGERGEALLLLHGGGGSYRDFEHLVPRFMAAGFCVVRPELRPHALSELPPHADISHSRIARDLKELLDSEGISAAHVAGWSHGGCVALQFAHDFPQTTRSLGLFSTFAAYDYGSSARNLAFRLQSSLFGLLQLMPLATRQRMMQKMLQRLFLGQTARRASPEACQLYEDASMRNVASANARLLGRSIQSTYRFDARPWLAGMTIPALVITGARDHIPTEFSDVLVRALPRAELARWPDSDHGILFSDPEGFAARYLQFLTKVQRH